MGASARQAYPFDLVYLREEFLFPSFVLHVTASASMQRQKSSRKGFSLLPSLHFAVFYYKGSPTDYIGEGRSKKEVKSGRGEA